MSFVEVLTANGLTVEIWDASLFKEYILMNWWKNLMGTSQSAIIQIKDDLTKRPGDAMTIGIRGKLIGGHVEGNATGIGNEGTIDFFNQRITVDNVRDLVKFKDVPMSQKRVSFNLLNEGKDGLQEASKERFEDSITNALSVVTTGRVRGRYLYGAVDANWNATHATALQNVDNTDDQLTTNMISITKRKAKIPGNAIAKMRPWRVKNGKNFEEWFVYVAHTLSVRDLVENDAVWRNEQLNLPPQSNTNSPIYTGSSFKGAHDGVLVYEYERLNLISSTIQVAHNFLLGAQAAAVVWGQRSKFGEEDQDLKHTKIFETHEIRGIAKLAFSRSTVEDNGVIHSFPAAVND